MQKYLLFRAHSASVHHAFATYDTDKDGYINVSQLAFAFRALGHHFSETQLDLILKVCVCVVVRVCACVWMYVCMDGWMHA